MSTYDINKIQLPNGDICNLRDANAKTIAEYKTLTDQEFATFDDGVQNSTLKNYSIKIEPKQDLHGYDKPWVGGAGKNLAFLNLNNDNSYTLNEVTFTNVKVDGNIIGVNGNGTPNSNNNFFVNNVLVASGTEYKLCNYTETGTTTTYWVRFVFRDSNGTALNVNGSPFIDINALSSKTVTAPSNAVSLWYYINFSNGVAINNVVFKFAIYVSSSAPTSFEPYSNICPITGWTGAKVTRTGKNLLPSNLNVYQSVGTYLVLPNFIPENVEVHFTFEDNDTSIDISNCYLGFTYDVTNSSLAYRWVMSNGIISQNTTNTSYSGTGRENHPICSNVFIYPNTTETLQKLFARYKIMVEMNSTNTPYEPYESEIFNIQFPVEAGTVYGGSLDVTNGVLTVTDGYIESYNGETLPGEWISDRDVYAVGTSPTTGAQVVYKLATPLTYILIANQLTVLLGTNHIWADAGNITITYPTNLKGHIDTINNGCIKKSQQAQTVFYGLATSAGDSTQKSSSNAIGVYTDEARGYILHMLGLDAIIGNYELDEYADKDYSVDQLFMMKGKLYKATSFIPQGGSIVPNTNCVQTTILENLINQTE